MSTAPRRVLIGMVGAQARPSQAQTPLGDHGARLLRVLGSGGPPIEGAAHNLREL